MSVRQKVWKKFARFGAAKDFFGEIVGVNIDADGSDHAILFPNDGNGGALELACAEVELVV